MAPITTDRAGQSDEDQGSPVPVFEPFDEAHQKGKLLDQTRLKWEMVRCTERTSERLKRSKQILSKTTELVAYSHEAIKRSGELLAMGKRHRIPD
jgi:hypothetical protein